MGEKNSNDWYNYQLFKDEFIKVYKNTNSYCEDGIGLSDVKNFVSNMTKTKELMEVLDNIDDEIIHNYLLTKKLNRVRGRIVK